ncbi:MAG: glycosyltransferase family 4 protein [Chloroflexi bacterium]|nr:glycosyltransferase family 4 protein [Chloroflexota bacterium]
MYIIALEDQLPDKFMKIALIAPTYLPARRANTIQVMKMAQALVSNGHEVCVAVPGKDPNTPWEKLAAHYGLSKMFSIEWLPAHPRLRRYDYGYRAVRWARSWDADLIYTRLPQAAALASLRGYPTVFEVHDMPSGKMGGFLFRSFLRGSGALRLVVITQALASALKSIQVAHQGESFTLIAPDGIDLERYENLPAASEARQVLNFPDRFTAGYTGHLYAGRGISLLLSAAGRLPEISFLLVGGEPEDVARVELEVKKAGLQNVILTGFVPNAELPRYQSACDVLLMPYQKRVAASSGGDIGRYLSPLKLFEYLACGRPVLSSDLPVFREVLTEENAVLLPPEDIEAWVKALQIIQSDPEKRTFLSVQSRNTVSGYSWETRGKHILEGLY